MSDASSWLRDPADGIMGESREDLAGSFENFQQRFGFALGCPWYVGTGL